MGWSMYRSTVSVRRQCNQTLIKFRGEQTQIPTQSSLFVTVAFVLLIVYICQEESSPSDHGTRRHQTKS